MCLPTSTLFIFETGWMGYANQQIRRLGLFPWRLTVQVGLNVLSIMCYLFGAALRFGMLNNSNDINLKTRVIVLRRDDI